MDFQELALTRRTVHNYKNTPVDEHVVREALRLALWSPNHKLTYPWKFYSIGPKTRVKLADLSIELKSAKGALSDIKAQALRAKVINPSHVIVVGINRSNEHTEHEDYATLAGSLLLAALCLWGKGIGTKWSTGGWSMHEKTYKILDIDPTQVRLEGALMIGWPEFIPVAPERPELETFFTEVD